METIVNKIIAEKYSAYKNSGIQWLGEIPEHWKIESFRNILKERNEKNHPIKTKEILSLSIGKGVTLYAEKTTNLDRFKDDFSQYKLAYKGDLVLNSMNMIVGAVGVSDYFGCVSPVYYTYYGGIDNSFTTKFYEYLFRCKTVQGVLYSLGKGLIAIDRGDGKYNTLRLKVSRDDLRSLRLPFPNQLEVTAIVNFLDHKTALIDQAIDIKQKQIELLKERRQILIHKAITRGLNPDVKMKDSGVEWIGEIPEHWEVFELKRLINPKRKITYGIVQPGEPDPHGRYMIRGQDYSKGWADRESLFRVSNKIEEPYKRARVIPGDIIITIVGAGCGNLEIIPDWLDGANLTQTTARVAIDQSAFWSKYFYYTLLSNVGISQMRLYIKGAAQPGLNLEHIKIYKLPTPLYQEQIEISNYIESIEVSFKTALTLKEQEIDKLKEYKVTLINSAVTGKIKVYSDAK